MASAQQHERLGLLAFLEQYWHVTRRGLRPLVLFADNAVGGTASRSDRGCGDLSVNAISTVTARGASWNRRAPWRGMLTLAPLAAALCAGGCGSPPGPTHIIRGPGELKVSGFVSNRVNGEVVDGSRVDFRGYETLNLWQRVHRGRYQVHGLAEGTYEVVVLSAFAEWPELHLHREHRTERVEVRPDSLEFDFSVLVYGTHGFGAVYDREFDVFFNELARVEEGRDAVWKWIVPPDRIYVTRDGISDAGLVEFLSILREVNRESVSDMFGGTTGPLAIESGPPIGDGRAGTIAVRFHDGPTLTDLSLATDGSIIGAGVRFSSETFDDTLGPTFERRLKKGTAAHELWHCAGATDVVEPGSLMHRDHDGSVVALSPRDRLAAGLMYHPDTHPGSRAPDTNPTYIRH